jgi:ribonuclease HI
MPPHSVPSVSGDEFPQGPNLPEQTPVIVYTDGACSGNPGPGGWCAILRYGNNEKVLQGGASLTTNNRMELRAALAAFQALLRPSIVEVHTDSEYLRRGITEWLSRWQSNGWRTAGKKPVKNRDLWVALHTALRPHQVSWHWVKGHAGNVFNERADRQAVAALNSIGLRGSPDLEEPGAPIPV